MCGRMQVIEKPSSASAAAGLVVALVQQSFKATDSGIVYCQTRKDSESLAGQLQEVRTADPAPMALYTDHQWLCTQITNISRWQ